MNRLTNYLLSLHCRKPMFGNYYDQGWGSGGFFTLFLSFTSLVPLRNFVTIKNKDYDHARKGFKISACTPSGGAY